MKHFYVLGLISFILFTQFSSPNRLSESDNSAGLKTNGSTIVNAIPDIQPAVDAGYYFTTSHLSVTFTDTSAGPPTSWLWDFGDGNTSTQQNPSYNYANPGTYKVCLTVLDASTVDSVCHTVIVTCPNPESIFSFSGSGTMINFVDLSNETPSSWLWDLGDGNTSTQQNPSHTYAANGIYTVCSTVTNECGTDSSCATVIIPACDLRVDPLVITDESAAAANDGTLTVTAVSSYPPITYTLTGPVNAMNGTGTFNNLPPGDYTIRVTDANATRPCAVDSTFSIQAFDCGFDPDIMVDMTNQCNGGPIHFSAIASGVTSYLWDFGDGQTSTDQNPTHTYQDTGRFTVTLTVSDGSCFEMVAETDFIYVTPPIARFSLNPPIGCSIPHTVFFTDQSILPDTWFWDFGDNNQSTAQNPIHSYTSEGTFVVTLTVTDTVLGCQSTYSDTVKVSGSIISDFSGSPLFGCNPLAVDFQTIVTQTPFPIVAWDWDFGDGNNSNLSNPSHTYQVPGTYTVTLNVTDEVGCTNFVSKSNYVQVIGPDVAFSADTTQSCGSLMVQFTDLTMSNALITDWLWDFGDGSSSTMQNPSHTYTSLDSFDVTLTITDMDGCMRSLTQSAFIDTKALCSPYVCNLTCPNDTIINLDPFGCEVMLPAYAIEDSCLSFLDLISGQLPGTPFPIGTTSNEVILTDPFGFSDTCRFTITVIENGSVNPIQNTAKRAAAGLACHDQITISLGQECSRLVTARDVLIASGAGCIDRYNCFLTDPRTGETISGNLLSLDHAGRELTYVVQEIETGNKCWGVIHVENKLPPQLLCVNDTISCLQMGEREDLVIISNPCTDYPSKEEVLEKQWRDLGCDDREFIGYLARKVRATDVWGNYMECRDTLFVRKETIDSLVCGPDTVIECNLVRQLPNGTWVDLLWNSGAKGDTYLDAQGYAHPWPTDGAGVFPAPYLKSIQPGQDPGYLIPGRSDAGPDFTNNGKCQIVFDYDDHLIPTCGKAYKIRRTWHIYDWCGGSDTTCVQWFIVEDHFPPRVMTSMLDDARRYYPDIIDFNKLNSSPFVFPEAKNINVNADPHDCKAGVQLPDVREFVERSAGQYTYYECDDELELYYEVSYSDPGHPGKELFIQGNYDIDGGHLYLPAGLHPVLWTIRDRCWNEFKIWQMVYVYDNTPPVPVCDEITQVTLDPQQCWARVYAKDLDDGSHDNCCDQLHFAVANMDSVTYWDNYWHEYFLNCFGESEYNANKEGYDAFIEDWINSYVFDDYIDVTECGSEQLVLRVYEACGLPAYDPHAFFGGEHQWYWFNHSPLFLINYLWKLDEYIHYGNPRYRFVCDDGNFGFDIPVNPRTHIFEHIDSNPELTEGGYSACNSFTSSSGSRFEYIAPFLAKILVPAPWNLCDWVLTTNEAINDWKKRVFEPYRTEAEITKNLNLKSLYYTPVKYSDCMIEVRKDDKTPPVVVAPEDVTVYCDGVPYYWELIKSYAGGTKTNTIQGYGAQFTHDVCWNEDVLTSYCTDPFVSDPKPALPSAEVDNNTTACCVEIPWDGGDFGYYGGSVCGGYSYAGGVNCDEYNYWYESHNWQPIYCRLWLMLDKYDNPDGGHPDPQGYFDETAEDWVITDNCWAPETIVEYSGSLNECGVGTLTKTMTATDKCGNTAYDTQTLYVKPRSDFEVIFPEDVVVNCTDPGSLAADRTGAGYPEISDDDCELIGVTYSDERYDVTEGCYKILRTWKLIDWCVYSPDLHSRYPDVIVDDRLVASESRCCIHRNLKDDGDGYMTYLQVIKVVDDEAPVLECAELEDKCITEGCGEATVVYNLIQSVSDNCTLPVDMAYRYRVEDASGVEVLLGEGQVLVASLPAGIYSVRLIATDRCGNEDSCYTTFTIRDCKKPTPYCFDGISTVVMSPSGEVEVWATDFDAGSYDNCTTADKLVLSFTDDGESPSWTYTCADIPDGRSQEIEVTIWVIDEAGNKDFCTTTLVLQDNTGNACTDTSPLTETNIGISSPGAKIPDSGSKTPELYQNTPNPFSGETKIGFWLPESMTATLKVLDVTGKELYRVTGSYSGGNHLITLESGSIPEVKGILFYQLETEQGVLNKRMVKVN